MTPVNLFAEGFRLRDEGHGRRITYSRKVFIPLTTLCRDSCRDQNEIFTLWDQDHDDAIPPLISALNAV